MRVWHVWAIDAIVKDICGRRGIKAEWEAIDDDIKDQIIDEWREILERNDPATRDKPTTEAP